VYSDMLDCDIMEGGGGEIVREGNFFDDLAMAYYDPTGSIYNRSMERSLHLLNRGMTGGVVHVRHFHDVSGLGNHACALL
jgi:hypothetical protein